MFKKIIFIFALSLFSIPTAFADFKPPTQENKFDIIKYAFSVLNGEFRTSEIEKLKGYDRLFVSFFEEGQFRCSQSATVSKNHGRRTEIEIEKAVNKCKKTLKNSSIKNLQIVFSFLFNQTQIPADLNILKKHIEPGVHGLAIKNIKNGKFHYFTEFMPIIKNQSLESILNSLCEKAGLEQNCYNDGETRIYKFDALSFKGDASENLDDLYRSNVLFEKEEISKSLVKDRLTLAKNWFLNNQSEETGRLEYMYHPSTDEYERVEQNDIRQLASIWAMSELGEFLETDSMDEIIKKQLDYYLEFKICKDNYCYLNINGKDSIANNAFMILALLKNPDYPGRDELLNKFSQGILNLQQEDGSYKTHFNSDKISGADYYPGEAVLALIKLYNETKNETILNSVYKGYFYYSDYWRGNKNSAFIPWHSQAYLYLYEHIKNQNISEFVFEMNDWMINTNQIQSGKYIDEIGGFPKSSPRNATSSYLEGINHAYKLARVIGDEEHVEKYEEALESGYRFILLTQYVPGNSFYLKNPNRAIGGFRASLTTNSQRIDYVQHAILALMKAYEFNLFY